MKYIENIFSIVLAVIMILSMSVPVYAAGSVTYDGNADKFIFAPGTNESPTNMFENFQGVMPGDTITEQITVRNDKENKVKIKIYMKSLGAQENTDDFLSQLNLTVRQRKETVLFDAPANETAQLTDWTYIGTLYSGGEITLDVVLEVPITLGTEYQNSIGYVDWQFKVEELPIDPSDPLPPETGDPSKIFLYVGIFIAAIAALIVLLTANKKKKEANA